MLLLAEGKDLKTFRVRRLVENSPATVAGVREGDIIYAVDGKPTSNLTLEQVRGLFKHDGRAHRLTLEREGRKLETRIRLRRLI
jgi:C-terminal processing protease CtpA/Prc